MNPAYLLACLSYATDVMVDKCCYHSWRMALMARRLATKLSPDLERDVFYGAMMQDLGAAGAREHIHSIPPSARRNSDSAIQNHPALSASMLNWLPGMATAAKCVRNHHTWYRGRRKSDQSDGGSTVGSQILSIVDSASRLGCFTSMEKAREGMRTIARQTSMAWPREVCLTLTESINDSAFYHALIDGAQVPGMIKQAISELALPEELVSSSGVDRILHLWTVTLDLKDPQWKGHALRTAGTARELGESMKLSDDDCTMLYRAGLIHDCGKLGMPTGLLSKAARYQDYENEDIKVHSSIIIRALTCLPGVDDFKELAKIAGHHHERMDGRGYPDRLDGENIPWLSRVLSVADAYDAMTAPSDYRIITPKAGVLRLKQAAGTYFDPDIVKAMASLATLRGESAPEAIAA